jgi:hypothetical protein
MSQAGIVNTNVSANPAVPTSFVVDVGGPAVPVANVLDIIGGVGITTSAVGNVVTITGVPSGILSLTGNSGTASPTLGNVNILGSDNIVTSGSGSTLTISLSKVDLAHGGTNANLTASNGGIFYSTATAGAILAGTATAGQILQSGASSTPSWSTATYPAQANGAGKILIADGTNWVESNPTFPTAAGASGNVLTSNGTNWTSAAPSSSNGLSTASITLTNSQIKNLNATNILILAGQGAGKIIVPILVIYRLIYGGTNPFTFSANVNFGISNSTNGASGGALMNQTNGTSGTWYSQSANTFGWMIYNSTPLGPGVAVTALDNSGIYASNNGAGEVGGNAANNNTMKVTLFYQVLTY